MNVSHADEEVDEASSLVLLNYAEGFNFAFPEKYNWYMYV